MKGLRVRFASTVLPNGPCGICQQWRTLSKHHLREEGGRGD